MLDLALSQKCTRVFHLWKPVALDNAWVKDSCPFISFFFHSGVSRVYRCGTLAFFVWGSQTMLTGLSKNTSFGPPPNLHKSSLLVEVY